MNTILKKKILILTALVLLLILIRYMFVYLTPFIIAIILAGLIEPAVSRLEDLLPVKRKIIVLFILLLLITIFIIILIVGLSQVYLELNVLIEKIQNVPSGYHSRWLKIQNDRLQDLLTSFDFSPQIHSFIDEQLPSVYSAVRTGILNVANTVLAAVSKLPSIFTILFLSFIATYFISRDRELIAENVLNLFPENWREKIINVYNDIINSAAGFLRAEFILISITGIISFAGLLIIGSRYALILAVSAALLDLIPIIGPALIFYPWMLYNLLTGNLFFALQLLILHTVLAAVRSALEGKIMGENLGLHPLSTMIALYSGYRILGPSGFIIGPAILVIIKSLVKAEIITIK